ncbi:unnamed protein product [Brassica oleracea var. botrytis]
MVMYEENFVLNSRGMKLFTCVWKPVKQEPKALLFLCHGYAAETSITMNSTATRLAKAGFAVYGMDYEGHGKSEGLSGYISNFDDLVDDVSIHYSTICEKEENKGKMRFLLGESMGGAVVLLLARKKPDFWDGAVLVAPMCKLAEEVKPHPVVISILIKLCSFIPTWKIVPGSDILDIAIKEPHIRTQVRKNEFCYKGRPRLNTAYQLLLVSLDLEKNLQEVSIPFIVLHGEDDKVTDKSVSKMLYEVASSSDKTVKLYPNMWHALLYGETPENSEIVFTDVIKWLASETDDIKYEESFIRNSRGLKLFTCKWLPTNQEPRAIVFLCHGYGMECSITMNSTARRIVKAGFGVYGMDYEGHGKSDGLSGYIPNFDHLVDDVSTHYTTICEREENKGKMRFMLGESMGGAVVLLLSRKKPEFWDGALLVAPMCKIAEEMKPSPFVISILTKLFSVIPKWKIIPTQDIIDISYKEPEIRKQVRENPLCYKGRPRLKTAYELLRISIDLEKRLQEVLLPFMVLHGDDDKVTDKAVSQELYRVAVSSDKTLKLYSGMWHGLLNGETQENIEIVFADVIGWLEKRTELGNDRFESELKHNNDGFHLKE